KTGHFGTPKLCLGTTGQATRIRNVPVQNGMYGHISVTAWMAAVIRVFDSPMFASSG
ncbi:hypothetical protein AVEN_265242-1, partial [Araneus ventricosus]